MKLFVDTAHLDEIKQAADWGILDGVTTNPSLLPKEMERTGMDYREILHEICEIVDGPVSGEVVATDYEGMMAEAHDLASIHDHVIVKIPMLPEGMKAVSHLSDEGIRTNVTLVFSPSQALLAAKAGATYVSPFVGRIDDKSGDGMEVVSQIVGIFETYNVQTEVLAASIRHPLHVVQAAQIGADIATMPFEVLEKMFAHPLTDIGLEKFLKDWEQAQAEMAA